MRNNRFLIVLEILAISLIPISLALMQIPRTIIPLFLLGWFSLRSRQKSWKDVGFSRPARWYPIILAGSCIAIAGVILSKAVISPLLLRWMGEARPEPAGMASILDTLRGNLFYLLFLLIGIWLLAAIGEELVYRGYFMNRLSDLFGNHKAGWSAALVLSSLLFGLGHGISKQIILSGFLVGLVEGGLYLANRRNLWMSIIFHGVWDSTYLILFFLNST